MNVITLGPDRTFSHELAVELFGSGVELVPTINAIFELVVRGDSTGLVPIENSDAGGVGPTLNGLQRYSVFITGEVFREIHHHLASMSQLATIRVIFAHPQTHEQCSDMLDRYKLPVIHTASNAESAVKALSNPNAGAILSERAAEHYKVPIIQREIQNQPHNVTRFILISRTANEATTGMKCSILIDPQVDRVGLLHNLLGVFAKRGINLTRIESRPSRRGMGSYVFFVDFNVEPTWQEALNELSTLARVKNFGCYPEIRVHQ